MTRVKGKRDSNKTGWRMESELGWYHEQFVPGRFISAGDFLMQRLILYLVVKIYN